MGIAAFYPPLTRVSIALSSSPKTQMCRCVHSLSEQTTYFTGIWTSVHQIWAQPSPLPRALPVALRLGVESFLPAPSAAILAPVHRSVSPAGVRAPLAIYESSGFRGVSSISGTVSSLPREGALWGPVVDGPLPSLKEGTKDFAKEIKGH